MPILKLFLLLNILLIPVIFASDKQKKNLVLMPVRLSVQDKDLKNAIEIGLTENLRENYNIYFGDRVQEKIRETFVNESQNAAGECDALRCMQDIAIAFQSELICVASISKQEEGYFLALSIQNIFDNQVTYSQSKAYKKLDEFELLDKLKDLIPPATSPTNVSKQPKEKKLISKDIWLDQTTHLMWQDEPYTPEEIAIEASGSQGGKVWNWENANLYCENLTYAGYDDWKLPTIDQLKTILSPVKTSKGYMKEGLKHIAWTYSSEDAGDVYASSSDGGKVAWLIDFAQGRVYTNLKEFKTYVRCVRDYKE